MKHSKTDGRERASELLSKNGYGKVKSIVKKGIEQHDEQLHGGKKTRLHLATGGRAKGEEAKHRLDRKPRAHGGRNKGKEAKVAVNVINAGKQPVPVPMPGGAPMPPRPMPAPMAPAQGAPPMGARPPMPMPPQGGGMPPRPFAKGGPVRSKGDHPHLDGGAGGGLGRLQKAEAQSKRKKAV